MLAAMIRAFSVLPRQKRRESATSSVQHTPGGVRSLSLVAHSGVTSDIIAYVDALSSPDAPTAEPLSNLQLDSGPPDQQFELELPTTLYWRVHVLQPQNIETEYTVIAIIEDEQSS